MWELHVIEDTNMLPILKIIAEDLENHIKEFINDLVEKGFAGYELYCEGSLSWS